MTWKTQRRIQAQALANAGVTQHNARRERAGQVDMLTDLQVTQQHGSQQLALFLHSVYTDEEQQRAPPAAPSHFTPLLNSKERTR